MLIDFGAEWCAPCKEYETKIFADPEVHSALAERFVALKFDLTSGSDEALDAQERWSAKTLPTVILLDGQGKEARRFGEPIPDPSEFAEALRQVR